MPQDLTSHFNTALSPADEAKFQAWLKKTGKAKDLYDYDLRGWWAKNGTQDSRGHMTDEFKKPNHPTFSTESQYSTPGAPGGRWIQTPGGGWNYVPSAVNLQQHGSAALQSYFQRVEPDSKLILPLGTNYFGQ